MMGRPPGRPPKREIWEATESFATTIGGEQIVVNTGHTTETGSELLEKYPQFFRRIQVTFPAAQRVVEPERIEQATAAPGETRW